jgi:hypothetical protein
MHPQPRVGMKKPHEIKSPQVHRKSARLSPRNGFTVSFVLSPVTGLFCHRRLRELLLTNLTPASGRQDHTTSPSAPVPLVLRHPSRPSHPLPNVRDDRETPLLRARDRETSSPDFPFGKTEIFLQKGLDSFLLICPFRALVPRMQRSAPLPFARCAADPGPMLKTLGRIGPAAHRTRSSRRCPHSIFLASSGSMIGMPSRIG